MVSNLADNFGLVFPNTNCWQWGLGIVRRYLYIVSGKVCCCWVVFHHWNVKAKLSAWLNITRSKWSEMTLYKHLNLTLCFPTFDQSWVFTCFAMFDSYPVCTLCKHQCTCAALWCWYVHVYMLDCLQSVPYGLCPVQPCKQYTVGTCLLCTEGSEAYIQNIWTCLYLVIVLLQSGVWARALLVLVHLQFHLPGPLLHVQT